jgi:3-dehydroquinate synthetase
MPTPARSTRSGSARRRPTATPSTPPRLAQRPGSARGVRTSTLLLRFPGLPPRTSRVVIGPGVLTTPHTSLLAIVRDRRAVLVTVDAGLGPSAVEPLLRALDALRIRWGVCVIRAEEVEKSLSTAERILVEAARLRLDRGDLFIGVGGGIVGDLTGLAASLYRRGVEVVQCPSTLLAMVDASVGGKTGANLVVPNTSELSGEPEPGPRTRLIKNAIGSFHQPVLVLADLRLLETLPEREYRAGCAEVLKHGLIGGQAGDPRLLEWVVKHAAALRARQAPTVAEAVRRSVALKARVVQRDERELSTDRGGGRMALNLGHTFAHVLEVLPGLTFAAAPPQTELTGDSVLTAGPLRHGEAVGLGLLAAASLAETLRLHPRGLATAVETTLATLGLPTRVSGLPPSSVLIERMRDDKKTTGGRLRLIVPVRGAKVRVVENPDAHAVSQALDSLRQASG